MWEIRSGVLKSVEERRQGVRFLTEYLLEHNRRFARPEDYYGRKPTAREFRQIFRLETERRINNDWVIRHEGRYLQLQPGSCAWTYAKQGSGLRMGGRSHRGVLPRGPGSLYRAERAHTKNRLTARPTPPAGRAMVVRKAKQDHPWQQGYQNIKPWVPNQGTAAPLVGMLTYASP